MCLLKTYVVVYFIRCYCRQRCKKKKLREFYPNFILCSIKFKEPHATRKLRFADHWNRLIDLREKIRKFIAVSAVNSIEILMKSDISFYFIFIHAFMFDTLISEEINEIHDLLAVHGSILEP